MSTLLPNSESTPRDTPSEMTEIWRNIKALWNAQNGGGSGWAKVYVGSEPPPDFDTGTLWYDTSEQAPTT